MSRHPLMLLLCFALAGCGQASGPAVYQGYVEGEFVLVAPQEAGRVVELAVRRGETVKQGQLLFRLDEEEARAQQDEAKAHLAQARADLANLEKSQKRAPEIAAIEAQIEEAEATLIEARRQYERVTDLAAKKIASARDLDLALAHRERAAARVEGLRNERAAAALPARPDQIEAARRQVAAAEAVLARTRWRLGERTVRAPTDGLVEETLRRPGETASPSAPVVSLLPPHNRKVRFFIPEHRRAGIAIGQRIDIACDGCPPGLQGEIAFIASEPEYTPPVIYSVESRQKLVFMVEARPVGDAARLHPGQIVDVTLSTEAGS